MVTDGDIAVVGLLGDGYAWFPVHVLVRAESDALAYPLFLRRIRQPRGRFKVYEKRCAGEDRASVFTVDVDRVLAYCFGVKCTSVVDAATFRGGATYRSQAGQGRLSIPRLSVMEFDSFAQLKPPRIRIHLLPAFSAACGNYA